MVNALFTHVLFPALEQPGAPRNRYSRRASVEDILFLCSQDFSFCYADFADRRRLDCTGFHCAESCADFDLRIIENK